MTEAQARKVKIGTRVKWQSNDNEYGRVVEKGDAGIRVKWDDDEMPATYIFAAGMASLSCVDIVK